ncbi:unnamed protein product [Vitrella brassicaformis CCMP3155]|uniref:magnesium chelatase n=3 Tax=Vitrella brassicaformis TaxID=1169539 RepID=A0A0G4EG49_VITBC|nr:unnamed protein product [Vitrella brassicaformis CCMP3155]|eukprot:CEL94421.1 unnamed protein product [Vitrella brassicaformis CCMP3155]
MSMTKHGVAILCVFLSVTLFPHAARAFAPPLSNHALQPHQVRRTTVSSSRASRRGLHLYMQDVATLKKATLRKPTTVGVPVGERGRLGDEGEFGKKEGEASIVFIAGFESFNLALYREAARRIKEVCPSLKVHVMTDRDVAGRPDDVAAALRTADAVFVSLIFDFDQVTFIKDRIGHIPLRMIFESALELMSETSVASFNMKGRGEGPAGPPPAVKALLRQFGNKREEDRLAGYLNFLKVGPKLLQYVPGDKARDLRSWLEIYSYWNQGGLENVVNMFLYIGRNFLLPKEKVPAPGALRETPTVGLYHPFADDYFSTPAEYLKWYESEKGFDAALAPPGSPRVAILLYRKHVLTHQKYIDVLIRSMEKEGLTPVPVFITGVEAHTIVRDLLTTSYEQQQRNRGVIANEGLSKDAIAVEAIVNTIGFPLVGGPAGSMEAGRQTEVSTQLLSSKNVPYLVAAPLLVQDIPSWMRNGVQGLQSVVLFALPELDGAVDPVVLGGLVADKIALVPERVRKLAARLNGWIRLRNTPPKERKIAIILYGFPPNVGATGTAALLNVPDSLQGLLEQLKTQGYDLGPAVGPDGKVDGEAIVAALKVLVQDPLVRAGPKYMRSAIVNAAREESARSLVSGPALNINSTWLRHALKDDPNLIRAQGITSKRLRRALRPILASKVEKGWGELEQVNFIGQSSEGEFVVQGVQLGNVWIGVQPLLGLEGDPMRLLFERDLTPHPQYFAFYEWLRTGLGAQACVHFGMHGTVEWLPGSPLGNTGLTWPDRLLGDIPNVYIYAANNPSESILAKRRGYGTLVSHNVPPYARAGLYKELALLRDLIGEYRSEPDKNQALKPAIVEKVRLVGLFQDCPWEGTDTAEEGVLSTDEADKVDSKAFGDWLFKLNDYLLVLEQRLFSEGLHCLGHPPSQSQMLQYLEGYFAEDPNMPHLALELIANMTPSQSVFDVLHHPSIRPLLTPAELALDEGVRVADLTPADKYQASLQGLDKLSFGVRRFFGDMGMKKVKDEVDLEVQMGTASGANMALSKTRAAEMQRRGVGVEGRPVSETEGGGMGMRGRIEEAMEIRKLLMRNEEELSAVVRALNGEYIRPAPGGDLLRDGAGVLPTGRNIHALDPYRMPSPAAEQRGKVAADKILEEQKGAGGVFPESVAVTLWGLDAIKTKGESVAIVLALVGARPVKEGTGRIVKFELIPLEELGRPRIDVLCSLSGIFRDTFANVVDLLDALFEQAAEADEPIEMNYIKKHVQELQAKGIDRPTARLFSNPAGDFGSMVNERVGNGEWEDGKELGDTWAARNGFSFGRKTEKGTARPELLRELLSSTERIVQEIDSVEYGLTDIQEYYANTGALKKAADNARESAGKKGKVKVSILESFSKAVEPRDLEQTLRMEYRTKLLNPKWAEAMAKQGSGGAYEISQRMTALVGWAGTTDFAEDWVYDGAAERYAMDEAMAEKLRKANPEAFQNVLRRMLEANGRGFWKADEKTLDKLREMYSQTEDEIEGVRWE